tara:strand:+ start:544 stop:714 length:171 start_codon:yes stop_codon:yes gene_type:complete
MESEQVSGLSIEAMIVAVGSFLYNSDNTICEIEERFLLDLQYLIKAELERREAAIH